MLIIRFIICFLTSMLLCMGFAQGQKLKEQNSRTFPIGQKKELKAPEKEFSLIINDPLMQQKWDLNITEAKKSLLDFSQGNRKIVVAVCDTGIDTNHPDLKENIWLNPKEIPGNKIDDDKNGFIDDVHGWNFAGNNNRVFDTHGHGTHIAGIIGAVGGNGIGLSGVAPKVSLMALKYYDPNDNGSNNLNNTIKCFRYAIANGAHIINYSGGGLKGNEKEKKALKLAEKKGILLVAAAGNEKSNMDTHKYYPASYPLRNILPVTATNPSDKILKSSNWGKSAKAAAPGIDILSTLPGGKYGRMTGTSQATAVATGLAVLIMDYYKINSPGFVIKQMEMTGDLKDSLKEKTSQGRRINIYKALAMRGKRLDMRDQIIEGRSSISYHPQNKQEENQKHMALINEDADPAKEERQQIKSFDPILYPTNANPDNRLPAQKNANPDRKPAQKEEKNASRKPSSIPLDEEGKVCTLKKWHFP